MQRIIGNEIVVFLKGSDNTLCGDLSGLLVDVSDENAYVQSLDSSHVFVIPRDNILYCTTDKIPPEREFVGNAQEFVRQDHTHPQRQYQEVAPGPEPPQPDSIDVYINQERLTNIPVPPTFNLQVWHEGILRVLMGNPEVQQAVAGKVQKGLEYYPGEVYIEVEQVVPPSQMPHMAPGYAESSNSFTMGGSPVQQYLSPTQMAARLNKAVKRGNDDGNKTNV